MEATRGGIVPCYVSRTVMTAVLQEAEETGASRGQLAKQALVEMLVRKGRLPARELERVMAQQSDLIEYPNPAKKDVTELRMVKVVEEPVVEERPRRRRRMAR